MLAVSLTFHWMSLTVQVGILNPSVRIRTSKMGKVTYLVQGHTVRKVQLSLLVCSCGFCSSSYLWSTAVRKESIGNSRNKQFISFKWCAILSVRRSLPPSRSIPPSNPYNNPLVLVLYYWLIYKSEYRETGHTTHMSWRLDLKLFCVNLNLLFFPLHQLDSEIFFNRGKYLLLSARIR